MQLETKGTGLVERAGDTMWVLDTHAEGYPTLYRKPLWHRHFWMVWDPWGIDTIETLFLVFCRLRSAQSKKGTSMTKSSTRRHLFFPHSRHKEPPQRFDGIAPVAYSCIWVKPDDTRIYLNGYGGEKSPSVMLAHGVTIGIEAALMDDPELSPCECVMEKLNFWPTQENTLFQQLRDGRTAADGHDAYRQLFASQAIADLKPRLPETAAERALIAETKKIAAQVAEEAYRDRLANPDRYKTAGVYVMRDALGDE